MGYASSYILTLSNCLSNCSISQIMVNIVLPLHTVLQSVMGRCHKKAFGEDVMVTENHLGAPLPASTLPEESTSSTADKGTSHTATPDPVDVQVSPLIMQCLQKSLFPITELATDLRVEIKPYFKENRIQVTPTKQSGENWQADAQSELEQKLSSAFTERELNIPLSAATEIAVSLSALVAGNCIAFVFKEGHSKLTAAGTHDAMKIVEATVAEISARFAKTEERITLNIKDYTFLSGVKSSVMKQMHPDVHVRFDPPSITIILQGTVQKVCEVKQALPKYCCHASVPVPLNPKLIEYFHSSTGSQQLTAFLQRQQHPSVFHIEPSVNNSLYLLCEQRNSSAVEAIARSVHKNFCIHTLDLSSSFVTQLPELDDYDSFCQELETTQNVQIETSSHNITIAGFVQHVSTTANTLSSYVREKSSITKSVSIEKGTWRFFHTRMQVKWSEFLKQSEGNGVQVVVSDKSDDSSADLTICMSGERMEVEQSLQSITELQQLVIKDCISVSRPGTVKYFREENTSNVIAGIEARTVVCIELTEVFPEEGAVHLTSDSESASTARFAKVCVAYTKEMKHINLHVGDITEFTRAEVIVNAANRDLAHVGGVAKAILDKGGPIIQQDSYNHVQRHGKLSDGEVWLTTRVGKLPCKALVHAVAPRWDGGQKKEAALLQKACTQSLLQAERHRSIAIPAIGSGVYGFPIGVCARALVEAAIKFSANNPLADLQEINFILFKHDDAHHFVTALKNNLPDENVQTSTQHVNPGDTSAQFGQYDRSMTVHLSSSTRTSSRGRNQRGKAAASPPLSLPNCIKLHKGSLLDVKVRLCCVYHTGLVEAILH